MRTKRPNAKNYVIDFIILVAAIFLSINYIHHNVKSEKIAHKKQLAISDAKFLLGELSLVESSLEKTISGVNASSTLAQSIQSALEEKSYKLVDSLSKVVVQFDPQIWFKPDLLGFEAFTSGDELKRLKPLSTRKNLLKTVAIINTTNNSFQENMALQIESFNKLIDNYYTGDKTKLYNKYNFYSNDKIANWFAQYHNSLYKEMQRLKQLQNLLQQLTNQIDDITEVDGEEED